MVTTYSFGNLISTPLRGAPVHGHALVDDMVKGTNSLLHGCQPVRAMGVHNVDISQLKTLQRCLQALNDMLPGKTMVVDEDISIHGTPVDLYCLVSHVRKHGHAHNVLLVLITRSLRFHPKCLMALPMTISALPAV